MIKVKVRCWHVSNLRPGAVRPDQLLISYPADNSGHSLITCLTCGALFAVTIAKEVYIGPPLETKLASLACSRCGNGLSRNWAPYPDTYLVDGCMHSFTRSGIIPDSDESVVAELDGIYET